MILSADPRAYGYTMQGLQVHGLAPADLEPLVASTFLAPP
jgi:hypothetical protein